MLLNFSDDIQDTDDEEHEANRGNDKGKTIATDEDLSKPFMKVLKCPLTGESSSFHPQATGCKRTSRYTMNLMAKQEHGLTNCLLEALAIGETWLTIMFDQMKLFVTPNYQRESSSEKRHKFSGDKEMIALSENVPITFPPVLARDLLEEALLVEAEVEGYLDRRIHVDEGASIEIMYEHCFNMIHPFIRSRLTKTQTIVFGFSGEHVKPLGKIELDVCFGEDGMCQRAIIKFTVIQAPSPYNIILDLPGLKQL
ncbi:hypothetical protein Tco_0340524 [Tanacetum coccineum]